MAEPRTDCLPHGHLGEPVYAGAHSQWLFPRVLKDGIDLKPVGSYVTSIPPSAVLPSEQRPNISARVLQQQAKVVAARHPELTPALASLASFAHTSHHITSLTAVQDPLISDRLAFGRADFEATTTNIIAISAGQAGELVRLIRMKPAQHSCIHDQIRSVAVPELDTREDGWWSGNGAPIQQIACADGSSTWIAVRLLQSTVILRPRCRRGSATRGLSSDESLCLSHIDANPVVGLSIDRTGGVPHADVSFNPWHQRQIAIVDQQGAWSVWELLAAEQEFGSYGVKPVAMGHLFDGHGSEDQPEDIGDGWGAVRFAGSESILVVCNRVHMAIFHVPSKLTQLGVPNLDLSRNSDWILDLRSSSRNRNHIFVVTSSQVFCIGVAETGDGDGKGKTRAVATTLRSWCHFRESDDTSLRLDVTDHDNGTSYILLLYSRLNDLVTVFQLSISSLSPSHAVVAFDPRSMSLYAADVMPCHSSSSGANQSSISTVTFHPVPHKHQVFDDVSTSDLDINDLADAVFFYKLFMLRSDLSVRECVYIGRSGMAINDPSVFDLKRFSRTTLQESAAVTPDDHMDASDSQDFASVHLDNTDPRGVIVGKLHQRTPVLKSDHNSADHWTLNSEFLYGLVTEPTSTKPLTMSSLTLDEQDRQLSPELMQEMIDKECQSGASGIKSLYEILDSVPDYADLDDASSRIEEVRSSFVDDMDIRGGGRTAQLEKLVLPGLLNLSNHSDGLLLPPDPSLTCMYEHLMEHWLRPLPMSIPGRTRMARERTLRRVAMALCLARAGLCLRAGGNQASAIGIDQTQSVSHELDLPVQQKEGLDTTLTNSNTRIDRNMSSPPQSSQLSVDAGFLGADRLEGNERKTQASLPAPAVTSTLRSATSTPTSNEDIEDPACERLRQYTAVSFQPRLTPSMSRTLSHWDQGSNPAQYDWSLATASVNAPGDVEGAADKTRRRSGVRHERLSKKRQGGSAKSASQSNPERLWGSQPQLLQPVASSSQLAEAFAPMSQVERGAHGGRQGRARKQGVKAGKARVAGF